MVITGRGMIVDASHQSVFELFGIVVEIQPVGQQNSIVEIVLTNLLR